MTALRVGLSAGGLLIAPAQAAPVPTPKPGLTIHVSTKGNDAWSGAPADPKADSTDGPLRTLQAARSRIRAVKKDKGLPPGGITVQIADGDYYLTQPFSLTAEDSGAAGRPIVYKAAGRGRAGLSGGATVPSWQPVSNPKVLALLRPIAAGKVMTCSLATGDFTVIPGFANGGTGFLGRREYPIALYCNDERQPIARWPNHGYAKMGECIGGDRHSGMFRFEADSLKRWAPEPDLWLDGRWYVHWSDQKFKRKAIDLAANTISVRNPRTHRYGFKTGQRFFAFNAISEIDQPGEWAVDRATRRLYWWPPGKSTATVASTETLLSIQSASHVTFDGLVLEKCRKTAVLVRESNDIMLQGCTIRHTGSWAVEIEGGRNCQVLGSDIYDLGEGGIKATGGERRSLKPGDHTIENNHIHHFGTIVATYRPGAAVYGVGNKIRHNLIHHADHQAIFFSGNNHLIENNIVHDVCLHASDTGALYACTRNWGQRGTIVRNNLIHALGRGLDGSGCHPIYLDDHTSGTTVERNILTQCTSGIVVGGGKDNQVTDNIVCNADKSYINLDSRGADSFAGTHARKGRRSAIFGRFLQEETLYRSSLWKEHYPTLLSVLDHDPVGAHDAHGNRVERNVNVGGHAMAVRNRRKVSRTCTIGDNVDYHKNPGFKKVDTLDLRLSKNAPILKQLPGFRAPDFKTMGLYADTRRASAAVKFGEGVAPMWPFMRPEERAALQRPVPLSVMGGRGSVTVDGILKPGEWPTRSEVPVTWNQKDKESRYVSRAWFVTDVDALCVAMEHELRPDTKPRKGHQWGKDDGVEIALASVTDSHIPYRMATAVLRGYADGSHESVTDGGMPEEEARSLAKAVRYAARKSPKGWRCEWRIPLTALGLNPKKRNYPIVARLMVYKSASESWLSGRQRLNNKTWDLTMSSHALCLAAFGDTAYIPGYPVPLVRIDVQSANRGRATLRPVSRCSMPGWAETMNRIVAKFNHVPADRWTEFQFEFMPLADQTVAIELLGEQSLAPFGWTYYDDVRVSGAQLVNGDFEASDRGWKYQLATKKPVPTSRKASIVAEPKRAASGAHVAQVTHDYRMIQSIRVRKGQKVTVRFKARGALPVVRR